MQDKELDDIFRSNLDGFEVQPSRDLWAGIAAGLNEGKRKRPVAAYISIAATVLVLISAGLFFIPEQVKVKPQQVVKNRVQKPSINTPVKGQPANIIGAESEQTLPAIVAAESRTGQVAVHKVVKASPVKSVKEQAIVKEVIEKPVTSAHQDEQVLAANTTKAEPIPVAVVPDKDVQLIEKVTIPEPEGFKTKPVMASVTLPQQDRQQAVQPEVKKKKGFGRFLNSIVSKIDKRNKVIEFDQDGKGDKITGINLGIIKITTEQD